MFTAQSAAGGFTRKIENQVQRLNTGIAANEGLIAAGLKLSSGRGLSVRTKYQGSSWLIRTHKVQAVFVNTPDT